MRTAENALGLDESYRVSRFISLDDHHAARVCRIKTEHICKRCNMPANVHGRKIRRLYHAPLSHKPCIIELSMRRYRCKRCGRTFWEKQPLISEVSPHLSTRCEDFIIERAKRRVPIGVIEHECGASKNIIAKVLESVAIGKHVLPVHMGIDEVKVFPRKRAMRTGEPHMASCIYDCEKGTLAEVLEGDDTATVRAYFESFTEAERDRVRTISCDMNGSYLKIARELFSNAEIFIDKFHVVKLVCEALDEVRKRYRDGLDADKRRPINRASKMLRAKRGNLSPRAEGALFDILSDEGAAELRRAYLCLQIFYEWSDAEHRSRSDIEEGFKHFYDVVRAAGVPEMTSCARSLNAKRRYIVNTWEHGRTNALGESLNRSIKDIKRECRGFNSFESFRRRMLLALGQRREPNKPMPLHSRSDAKKHES